MYQYISRGSFLALLFSGISKVVCIARQSRIWFLSWRKQTNYATDKRRIIAKS